MIGGLKRQASPLSINCRASMGYTCNILVEGWAKGLESWTGWVEESGESFNYLIRQFDPAPRSGKGKSHTIQVPLRTNKSRT